MARLLERSPNYATAEPLREVDANELTQDDFLRLFVERHEPCVVRGAAAGWPAMAWTPERIQQLVGDLEVGSNGVGVLYEPILEFAGSRLTRESLRMTIGDFLDELSTGVPRIQIYAEGADHLEALSVDLAEMPFLPDTPPRGYSDRYFISRRGFTDWHVHFADDTLTVQLTGTKELLLVEPRDFDTVMRLTKAGSWTLDPSDWGAAAELTPRRAVLEPGDAVYIPMHWWHAVEAIGDDLNITYAKVFATPRRWAGDLRVKNVRFSLLVTAGMAAQRSLAARRPRGVKELARRAWLVFSGMPAALWWNRPLPSWATRGSDRRR